MTLGDSGSPAPSMTASACHALPERSAMVFLRRSISPRPIEEVRARFNATSLADLLAPGNSASKCAAWRSGSPLTRVARSDRLRGEGFTDHKNGLADHPGGVHDRLQRRIRSEAEDGIAGRGV